MHFDDWFVLGMSILLPLNIVLALAAFMPLPREWKTRRKE